VSVERAARNLPKVKVLLAAGLNVYDVLGHVHLVVTRDAMVALAGRLSGGESA
jgi:ribosomal protein L4